LQVSVSYEEPFNGDYDHQDLFGIGEQVWYAYWDVKAIKHEARPVEIKKIIIDRDSVRYVVEYLHHELKDEPIEELEDTVLYENDGDAAEYAHARLILELQNRLRDAEVQVEITKQNYDKAVLDYSMLNESMKKLKEE